MNDNFFLKTAKDILNEFQSFDSHIEKIQEKYRTLLETNKTPHHSLNIAI